MNNRFGIDWSKVSGTHFWQRPHFGRRMFFRHITSALSGYFLLPNLTPHVILGWHPAPRW